MKTGQLLQIQTLQGKQVADFVAFTQGDTEEFLSTSVTRATNASIVPQLGMKLYSNRRQPMFEIVEDTVGRHDMLYACCDPVRYEMLGAPGHANCREALAEALTDYGIGYDRIPPPINWFMNVAILQRGELEIREPLAEKDDHVVLRALKEVIAAVSACPQDLVPTNGSNPRISPCASIAMRRCHHCRGRTTNKLRLSNRASWQPTVRATQIPRPAPARLRGHRRSDGLPRRVSGHWGAGLIVRSHGEAPVTAGAVNGASH